MALILQLRSHILQPEQLFEGASMDAPGNLPIHPRIKPIGQAVLQKGRYINKEVSKTIPKRIHPVRFAERRLNATLKGSMVLNRFVLVIRI